MGDTTSSVAPEYESNGTADSAASKYLSESGLTSEANLGKLLDEAELEEMDREETVTALNAQFPLSPKSRAAKGRTQGP